MFTTIIYGNSRLLFNKKTKFDARRSQSQTEFAGRREKQPTLVRVGLLPGGECSRFSPSDYIRHVDSTVPLRGGRAQSAEGVENILGNWDIISIKKYAGPALWYQEKYVPLWRLTIND